MSVEVFVCHKDNMHPDKPIPKAHTGFRRVVLADDYGALRFELSNALEYARQTMPPSEFAEAMAILHSQSNRKETDYK